ncbi:hypothetical protein HMPREF3188_01398 [Tissierellia bacterium KA00581]|nr:hypothetical protein HMPREF3188_01398 [Tissierellia bacterium KA00581]
MNNNYFEKKDLEGFANGILAENAKKLWEEFLKYYSDSTSDGALTKREKALCALAVAFSARCPYCIDAYTQSLVQLGVTEEEITEVLHVASSMQAGITLVNGITMKNTISEMKL